MPRPPIPTWCFALVVVRDRDRFLLVHERKHGSTWYLPAGRVEPGETFPDAALRETLEETGVPIDLDGIVRVEHQPHPDGSRLRVIFLAHPAADVPPKSTPDRESLGAAWFTLDQLAALDLRGQEVLHILRHVHDGGAIHPLSLLRGEGETFDSSAQG
jgi:8-oxo-dGTP pyrophosphatase MutT (NUDIX family)